jgi:hypothetical protein
MIFSSLSTEPWSTQWRKTKTFILIPLEKLGADICLNVIAPLMKHNSVCRSAGWKKSCNLYVCLFDWIRR